MVNILKQSPSSVRALLVETHQTALMMLILIRRLLWTQALALENYGHIFQIT